MPGGSRMTRRSQGRPNIPHLHEATIGCQNVVLANQKLLPRFPILLPILDLACIPCCMSHIQSTSLNLLVIDVSKKYLSQPGNQTKKKNKISTPFPNSPTRQGTGKPSVGFIIWAASVSSMVSLANSKRSALSPRTDFLTQQAARIFEHSQWNQW